MAVSLGFHYVNFDLSDEQTYITLCEQKGCVLDSCETLDYGMELHNLLRDAEFAACKLALRDENREAIAIRRLARVFSESPEAILRT